MSLAVQNHFLSHDDYFQLEQREDRRYEYLAGEVFAMAGGTESHALIAMNLGAALVAGLRNQPCRVYGSDMKLRIASLDKFCYPDLQVVCSQDRRNPRFVEAPSLVVEVLSESTESYDRGLKFEHYRQIGALNYYLLLDQFRPHAELFQRRSDGGWLLQEFSGNEAIIQLPDWQLSLPLAEIYSDVQFEARLILTPDEAD